MVVPVLGRVGVLVVVPVEVGGVTGITPGEPGLAVVPVVPVVPVVSLPVAPVFSVLEAPGVVGSRSVGLKPPIPGPPGG